MSTVVLHDCAFLLTRTFSLHSRACNGVKFTVYTNHLINFQLQSSSFNHQRYSYCNGRYFFHRGGVAVVFEVNDDVRWSTVHT